jgi:small-conductance mechanosensitive channel
MDIKSWINYELIQLGDFRLLVGNLIAGLLITVGTWLLVFILRRLITRPKFISDKFDQKRRLSVFLIIKYVIWVISLVFILEVIGIKITVLLVGSTAVLVGLGLGVQNIFKDLVSGLFLLFEGTIKMGDVIEADGVIGKVVEINLRSSQIMTRDDVTIIIPNSKFIIEKVVNWSHNNESVRFNVGVSVAYGSDVEALIKCLEVTMVENRLVLPSPKPFVRFTNFGESSLDFEMIFWTKEAFFVENIKSELRRAVYKKLNEEKFVIPFPQRDLHIKGLEGIFKKEDGKGKSLE